METPSVLVVLAEGFEEIEAITPIDLLRRAGANVTVAAQAGGIHVLGRNRLTVHADAALESVAPVDFDCVIIPGGPGVERLRSDPRVLEVLRRQSERNAWIAAICAAPVVLAAAGVISGKRFTAHPTVASQLPGALPPAKLVCDGKLLTSAGAGTALDFGLALVEKLFSAEKSREIAASICA